MDLYDQLHRAYAGSGMEFLDAKGQEQHLILLIIRVRKTPLHQQSANPREPGMDFPLSLVRIIIVFRTLSGYNEASLSNLNGGGHGEEK